MMTLTSTGPRGFAKIELPSLNVAFSGMMISRTLRSVGLAMTKDAERELHKRARNNSSMENTRGIFQIE